MSATQRFADFRDLSGLRDNLKEFFPQFSISPGYDKEWAMHRQGMVDLANVIAERIDQLTGITADPLEITEEEED